jgi:hypothetical protein
MMVMMTVMHACDNGDCHENNDDALEIKKLLCDDGHCDLLAE